MVSYSSLAYLDHNILDLMTKGDPHKVREFLYDNNCTPVYSEESIKEIVKSKGYESEFINLLEEIGAIFIEVPLNKENKYELEAKLYPNKPQEVYDWYLQKSKTFDKGDFGFTNLLMKMYGGLDNRTYQEIVKEGSHDFEDLLLSLSEDLSDEMKPLAEVVKKQASEIPDLMQNMLSQMTGDLDKFSSSLVKSFEEETGVGPNLLNNVTPPNVVNKIWDLIVEKYPAFEKFDKDMFLGVAPFELSQDVGKERTTMEKINGVYNALNFFGYHRDSKMKEENRYMAANSDMTHAGLASFCHYFLCRDKSLVMKAIAAYEYLGVGTKIIFYKTEKG